MNASQNAMPRVLFVGNYLPLQTGTRAISEDISRRLAAQGMGILRTSSQTNKVLRLAEMLGTVWRKRAEYDVAHIDVYSGQAFLFAEAVCYTLKRLNKPFVLTLHGGNLPNFARTRTRRLERLLQSAAVVTAPSRYLQETMQPYRADIRLLPNPVDLTRLTYHHRTQVQPKLIWLRAFHAIYQPTLAVEVLNRLLPKFPDLTLLMVGPDKGDGSLIQTQSTVQKGRLSERVTFTGGVPKEDVGAYLNRCEIFLNTTTVDNTPVSVVEAMASGLCIVSTDVGGLPFLLEHNRTALLVPPCNVEAMANAVQCLLENQGLASRLSQQAHETARAFDWSVILPQWQTLLQQTAKEGS